jgi:serine/threonine protein kinase
VTPTFKLADGITLEQLLQVKGALSPKHVIKIVRQIISLFAHLDEHGFSYGTISTGDIYICEDKKITLEQSAQLTY